VVVILERKIQSDRRAIVPMWWARQDSNLQLNRYERQNNAVVSWSLLELPLLGSSKLKLAHDGLEREFKFFK
jgi:hypothetical protein